MESTIGISYGTMGTTGKEVQSIRYFGRANPGVPADLIKDSDNPSKADVSVYSISGRPAPSCGFPEKSSGQSFPEIMKFKVDVAETKNHVVFSSAHRKDVYLKEDWAKYGYAHNPDEDMDRMDGFIDATVPKKGKSLAIEYVKLPTKSQGLVAFPEEQRMYSEESAMTNVNLFIRKTVPFGEMRNNDYGVELSKLENGINRARRFLVFDQFTQPPNYDTDTESYTHLNDRALRWARRLTANNIDEGRDVKGFGVVDLSDDNALGLTYFKTVLALAEDLEEEAWKRAEARNLSGREAGEFVSSYINSVIEHELYHFWDPDSLSKKASETRVGRLHSRHYGEQARNGSDTLQGNIDRMLTGIYSAYAEHFSSGRAGRSRFVSKLERLARESKSKAIASGESEAYAAKDIEDRLWECAEDMEREGGDLEELVEDGEGYDAGNDSENYGDEESYKESVEEEFMAEEDSVESDGVQEAEEAASESG